MNNPRKADSNIDEQFINRWSPRGFKNEPVSRKDLESIIEAGRWAPSCYGDQPWRLFVADNDEVRTKYLACLAAQNQSWAVQAPVLMFLSGKKTFSKNNKLNHWQRFDCGAFWMSMSLQANKLGLHTHAMAGFSPEKAAEVLNISLEEYDIIVAIALGYFDPQAELTPELKEMETPNDRMPRKDFTVFS